jgi:hypothetical protein
MIPTDGRELFLRTDAELAALLGQLREELTRRAPAFDPAASIRGQDYAKRAIQVALAGDLTILFVGPPACGKTMLRGLAARLGVAATFEAWPCPCGQRTDPRKPCGCESVTIAAHIAALPNAEVVAECTASRIGLLEYPLGETLEQIAGYLPRSLTGRPTPEVFHREANSLLKVAAEELGLDLRSVEKVRAIARSVARLDGADDVRAHHVAEAVGYRPFDRSW